IVVAGLAVGAETAPWLEGARPRSYQPSSYAHNSPTGGFADTAPPSCPRTEQPRCQQVFLKKRLLSTAETGGGGADSGKNLSNVRVGPAGPWIHNLGAGRQGRGASLYGAGITTGEVTRCAQDLPT